MNFPIYQINCRYVTGTDNQFDERSLLTAALSSLSSEVTREMFETSSVRIMRTA